MKALDKIMQFKAVEQFRQSNNVTAGDSRPTFYYFTSEGEEIETDAHLVSLPDNSTIYYATFPSLDLYFAKELRKFPLPPPFTDTSQTNWFVELEELNCRWRVLLEKWDGPFWKLPTEVQAATAILLEELLKPLSGSVTCTHRILEAFHSKTQNKPDIGSWVPQDILWTLLMIMKSVADLGTVDGESTKSNQRLATERSLPEVATTSPRQGFDLISAGRGDHLRSGDHQVYFISTAYLRANVVPILCTENSKVPMQTPTDARAFPTHRPVAGVGGRPSGVGGRGGYGDATTLVENGRSTRSQAKEGIWSRRRSTLERVRTAVIAMKKGVRSGPVSPTRDAGCTVPSGVFS
ncbi:uncharacterized protein EV422DRAFT_580231 [Fimicolochytrium jonesii]|uniref:uncharacterized protein n=1 Tax=Fimicolochytrium jonesii TaxID=1396493 RepID=UPI0022FE518A|nr:uncharacterized protein EV422DRAFT_580231 [Fimicolochytrium jonesii]KAI8818162.1 hypothetical protein EV422DRAFT_580231 [Fimicolochytrium jonesii]